MKYEVKTTKGTYEVEYVGNIDKYVLEREGITIKTIQPEPEYKIIDIHSQLPWDRSVGKNNKNSIKYVVIHHDAEYRPASYDSIARYKAHALLHINKGYGHISYHFRIDNVGTIFQTMPLDERGYHAGNWFVNIASIAVCFDGNMETQNLTPQQISAYKWLMQYLTTQRPDLPKVLRGSERTHGEVRIGGTACPGKNTKPYIDKY